MSYTTVRGILEYSEALHRKVSAVYEQLRDATQQARMDMLLKLLAAHEAKMAEALASYQEASHEAMLNEWHQFEPESVDKVLPHYHRLEDSLTVEELVEMAIAVDGHLLATYKELASEASSQKARELFENLATLEHAEKVSAVRAALSVNDW